MVENPRLQAKKKGVILWSREEVSERSAHEIRPEVHLVWVPKYRKKVLVGPVAIRARDVVRQIAMEHELEIISGKVARDHVHVFLSYRSNQRISDIVQWLKGISSRVLLQEFPHLRKRFWGRHLWARGYFAVTSGTITDEMIQDYIDEQEGEPLHDDSRFPIDSPCTPRLIGHAITHNFFHELAQHDDAHIE